MAKKTQAQKQAEQLAFRQAQRDAAVAAYQPRLMKALEQATMLSNMELTVRDGNFLVRDRDHREDYTLSTEYTDDAEDVLGNLEYELCRQAEVRAHAARLAALQQQARAKLTQEELDALGL